MEVADKLAFASIAVMFAVLLIWGLIWFLTEAMPWLRSEWKWRKQAWRREREFIREMREQARKEAEHGKVGG